MAERANADAADDAGPRQCAVCQRVCPVVVLDDLQIAEVCDFCKPLVLELVKVIRNGAHAGDDAIKRAVKVAKQLDKMCMDAERLERAAGSAAR
ncbi:MAG TPA: hypothetical protein VK447_01700 [Myxococcaceae bacterium]|nr:hypothetical protein [Myxococcaceae bacterium]